MKGSVQAMRHFKKTDPVLWRAFSTLTKDNFVRIDERLGGRPNPRRVFEDICETIIGQQLSGKAANTIYKRFKALCPKVTPDRVAALNLDELRGVGISYAKGRALHDLAYKVSEGILQLRGIEKVTDEDLRRRLIAVRGIGPWTAEMILMFTLYRPDVFSPGDLGLQKGVQMVYKMKSLPNHEQMLRKSLSWSPYRTYAAMLLWRLVDSNREKKIEHRNGVQ